MILEPTNVYTYVDESDIQTLSRLYVYLNRTNNCNTLIVGTYQLHRINLVMVDELYTCRDMLLNGVRQIVYFCLNIYAFFLDLALILSSNYPLKLIWGIHGWFTHAKARDHMPLEKLQNVGVLE